MRNRSICLLASALVLFGTAGAALAQSAGDIPAGNIAATGKHMPAVGQSKSDGVTLLDRKEERKMRKETTICKGC